MTSNRRMTSDKAEELRSRSRKTFDAQAATYDTGMEGSHARMLYPQVAEEVMRAAQGTPAPRLLDLGCGTGALAQEVCERVPSARLTCVDLSSNMVAAARRRLGDTAEVIVADAEHLPCHDGCFDVVWCNDSFHHYPDPVRAAFQVWRVLAAGGTFVLGDVWQPAPARAVMNAWMAHSHEGDVRIYSEAELRQVLSAWFDCVSWRRVGGTACIALAHKGR